jgi:formate dehydrogenase subunit gamma
MTFVRASLAALAVLLAVALAPPLAAQEAPGPAPTPPANLQPERSASDMWRAIRRGEEGTVPIPNELARQLIQSEGEAWRSLRGGDYRIYSGWAILGMIGLLALFFAVRGRVRIHAGPAGVRIRRFNGVERFAHWLTAVSFIVLALTGLNLIFGRPLLIPLLGKEAFGAISMWGKLAHNYLAFGFMLGLALMLVLWVVHNVPHPRDVVWLLKGGGLLGGTHPPAKKFNAGQKVLFWIVMLGGLSISLSGLQLLFPFTFSFFDSTFATLNAWLGSSLPTGLTPMAEQQLATLWHGATGVVLTAVILAHIYIGTVGMEGAFDAMGSGEVDLNWAREHHNLWVEELERKQAAPAE